MITKLINKKKVVLYEDVEELPILNFQKFNKYLLLDAGIGSDIDDVDGHIFKIAKFLNANNIEKAYTELQNLRQNIAFISSEISPKFLAFATLIHSINGKRLMDLSDTNLKAIIAELNAEKASKVLSILEKIKKNLMKN